MEQPKQTTTKRSYAGILFIIFSVFIIFGLNALLPLLEGSSHYTVEAAKMPYSDYVIHKKSDDQYSLTWASEAAILRYKVAYAAEQGLSVTDALTIEVPDDMLVSVYTKYFFESAFWWVSTATSTFSAILLFFSVLNYCINKLRERDPKYLELLDAVNTMVRTALNPEKFEPWMQDVFNHNRKVRQHVQNIKYKLNTLENRTPFKYKKNLVDYFKGGELTVNLDRRTEKYLRLKEALLYKISNEYITEYISSIRVKYFKTVDPVFIYNGVRLKNAIIADSYSTIKTDAEYLTYTGWKKAAVGVAFTFALATLVTLTVISSAEQSPIAVVVQALVKIAPLVMQIQYAKEHAKDYMQEQLIGNLLIRRSIGLYFLSNTKEATNVPQNQ